MSPKPRCKRHGECPGIPMGGGMGLEKIRKTFYIFSFFFQKIAEKMMRQTENVAKYRWNSLKFPLITFPFFLYKFPGVSPTQARIEPSVNR